MNTQLNNEYVAQGLNYMNPTIVPYYFNKNRTKITIKRVQLCVAKAFNIDVIDIYRESRKRELADARKVLFYILSEMYGIDYRDETNERYYGGQHRTTVYHAVNQCKAMFTSYLMGRSNARRTVNVMVDCVMYALRAVECEATIEQVFSINEKIESHA